MTKTAVYPEHMKNVILRLYKKNDYTGRRSGRVSVIGMVKPCRNGSLWVCVCDCGKEFSKYITDTSAPKKCSITCPLIVKKCVRERSRASEKHSDSRSREYVTWASMKSRCYNQNATFFPDYGGRGIQVCERWRNSYKAFLSDMGRRPEGCSIDRIDVNGNYEPGNCRWATNEVQSLNRRPSEKKRAHKPGDSVAGVKVVAFSRREPGGNSLYLFECSCGQTFESRAHDVTRGKRKSCGSCSR